MKKYDRMLRRMRLLAGRIPLMGKIFLLFIFGILFPMALQIITSYQGTLQNTQTIVHQQMSSAAERVQRTVNNSFHDASQLLIRYYSDSRLYDYFDDQYQTALDYLIAYQEVILPIVQYEIPFHSQLEGLSFYTTNKSIYNGAYVRRYEKTTDILADFAPQLENLGSLSEQPEIRFYVGTKATQKESHRCMVLTCPMTYYRQRQGDPVMVRLDLNMEYFNTLLMDTGLLSNMLLVDEEGRILCCANTYRMSGAYDTFSPDELPEGSVLLSFPLDSAPLTLYAYYDSGILNDQFWETMLHSIVYSLVGLVIASGALLIIGHSLSRHTRDILAKTERLSLGMFDDESFAEMPVGYDELAQIEQRINELSVQLQEYIEREYAAKLKHADLEKKVTESRLQALQSQVNPHFLFNALESIRLNALERDRQETARMIKHMARMFRYLVDWQGDIVPLHQELKFLDEYLIIQKYRFGSEFQYSIDLDEAARECLLPKLILQPLVENACVHGVEATSNQKHVKVAVRAEGERLIMQVSDNGCGMTAERLEKVMAQLRSGEQTESVGLSNVYQRLLLYYQQNFRFDISSTPGQGTVCMVDIPVQRSTAVQAVQMEGKEENACIPS